MLCCNVVTEKISKLAQTLMKFCSSEGCCTSVVSLAGAVNVIHMFCLDMSLKLTQLFTFGQMLNALFGISLFLVLPEFTLYRNVDQC